MKKLVWWLFFLPGKLFSEDLLPIETDRPDQTETPSVVAPKYLQVEMGFNAGQSDGDFIFVHPDVLWRVGIFISTELRLITTVSTIQDSSGNFKTGFAPLEIGIKTSICEEHKARPKISFIGHVAIPPLSSKSQRTKYVAPNFRFTLEHTFKEKIALGYNVGMEWDGFSPQPVFIYTLVNGYELGKKWYLYYEFFGDIPIGDRSPHFIDAGIAYLVKKNMQIDLSAGFQYYPFAKGWYASLGYSFRIPN